MKIFNNESIFEVIVNSNLNVKGDLKSSVAIRMNDDLANIYSFIKRNIKSGLQKQIEE